MATRTWNGSVSSDWTDADNWDEAAAPVDGDDIVVPATGVTWDPDLSTGTPIAFGTLTSESGGSVLIAGPITFNGPVSSVNLGTEAGPIFNALVDVENPSFTGGTFNAGIAGAITAPAPGGAVVDHIEFTRDASPTPLTTDNVASGDTATYHAQAFDADDNPLGDAADLAVTGTGGTVTFVPGIYTVKLG